MIEQLKRQYHNIFAIRAVSVRPLLKNLFLLPFSYKFNSHIYPVNIIWDITAACNLNCSFCLFSSKNPIEWRQELNTSEILGFINRISGINPCFYITGGEPLLKKDVEKIISAISFKKMKVGINTNGTLLTREKLLRLEKAGLDYIVFSLNPLTSLKADNEKKMLFEKVFKVIVLAKSLKLKTRLVVNTIIDEKNYYALGPFLDMLEEIGLDAIKFSFINFSTEEELNKHVKNSWERLRIENNLCLDCLVKSTPGKGEEIAEAVSGLKVKIQKMKTPVSFNPNLKGNEIVNWFNASSYLNKKCLFAFNGIRISPYGDFYPCHLIKQPAGNILKDNVFEVFNNSFYKKLRKELKSSLFPGCIRCCKL